MRARGATFHRPLVFLCGAAPALLATLLALYRPAPLARLDDAAYDALVRAIPTRPPSERVVIVDADERSLAAIGQWPWPRDVVADLIARLQESGASTIALDIIFAEPDRQGFAPRLEEAQATTDEMLARTLGQGRVVLGYAATFKPVATGRRPCVLHPVVVPVVQPESHASEAPFFEATDAVCSLPMLSEAAGASGFLNALPDSDGILRRVPLIVALDGQLYPSLALSAVTAATGTHGLVLRRATVNRSVLVVGSQEVPLDGKSNALVRFRGRSNTFRYVSAADVLSGALPLDTLRDKIVFVGTTALGARDIVATPLDGRFSGIEVQATVADNLLRHDFLSRSPSATIVEALGALGLGLAVAGLLSSVGLFAGLVAGLGGIGAGWGASLWQLAARGVYTSPVTCTTGVLGGLALMTVAKFVLERQRADRAGHERANTQRLMVQTLLSLTETRDAETGRHSRRTQQYARLVADQLSTHPAYRHYLTPERIDLLSSLAPLHDIGKVGIPDQILNKAGKFTPEEFAQMRKHPTLGRDVILKAERQSGVRDDETLAMAKDIVYTHHERWDGTGYPQGLRGHDIPIAGRVMAVVDVYDATSARRLYHQPMTHEEAVKLIIGGTGTHFDPAVVEAFVAVAPVVKAVAEEEQTVAQAV